MRHWLVIQTIRAAPMTASSPATATGAVLAWDKKYESLPVDAHLPGHAAPALSGEYTIGDGRKAVPGVPASGRALHGCRSIRRTRWPKNAG